MSEEYLSPQIQLRKILILSANPRGTSQLRLDEERREIREGLRRSKKRDQFEIETAGAVRYRDIHRAILDYEPNIVHFSGHGAGKDGLIFEDQIGQVQLVDGEALAGLFELFAKQVECVVLNACYSEVQAKAIAQHISYVIGMSQVIQDKTAIEFVIGFYDGLGFGETYEFSYKLGCNAIKMAGIPEHLTPQLLGKNYPDTSLHSPVCKLPVPVPTPQAVLPTLPVAPSRNTSYPVPIKTETEFDYTQLHEFLAKGQWKEADLETMRVMLEIAEREEKGWLQKQDIQQKLSDKDIQTINQLWIQYSKGYFGFSVQARIWQECKGEPGKFNSTIYREKFCDRTGWYINKNWLKKYDDFQFSLDAKKGHLPSLSFPDVNNNYKINWKTWKETFQYILPRYLPLY